MNIIELVGIGSALVGSGVVGGYFLPRLIKPKLNPVIPSARTRTVPLAYEYTHNGVSTGVQVPDGFDPVDMAARKSKREGRVYGVTRITPG